MKKQGHVPVRGMVFGVFDGLHPGHEYFLGEAAGRCDELVVVVTPDEVVQFFKKMLPKHAYGDRVARLKSFDQNLLVVPGDETAGDWNILEQHKPDIIFLGYDQQGIAAEMDRLAVAYVVIDSHEPKKYKSSILNQII